MKKTFKDLKLTSSVYGVNDNTMQRLSIRTIGGDYKLSVRNTNGRELHPLSISSMKLSSTSFAPGGYYNRIHFNIEDAISHVKSNIVNSMAMKASSIEKLTKEIKELKDKYKEY